MDKTETKKKTKLGKGKRKQPMKFLKSQPTKYANKPRTKVMETALSRKKYTIRKKYTAKRSCKGFLQFPHGKHRKAR